MRIRKAIHRHGETEWDLGKIEWYPGELEFVRTLPAKSQWTLAWAKRLRKPVDGRCFKVVAGKGGYGFVRVKDQWSDNVT